MSSTSFTPRYGFFYIKQSRLFYIRYRYSSFKHRTSLRYIIVYKYSILILFYHNEDSVEKYVRSQLVSVSWYRSLYWHISVGEYQWIWLKSRITVINQSMWNDFIFRWISIHTSGSRISISEMITNWHVDQRYFFQKAVLSI